MASVYFLPVVTEKINCGKKCPLEHIGAEALPGIGSMMERELTGIGLGNNRQMKKLKNKQQPDMLY